MRSGVRGNPWMRRNSTGGGPGGCRPWQRAVWLRSPGATGNEDGEVRPEAKHSHINFFSEVWREGERDRAAAEGRQLTVFIF